MNRYLIQLLDRDMHAEAFSAQEAVNAVVKFFPEGTILAIWQGPKLNILVPYREWKQSAAT